MLGLQYLLEVLSKQFDTYFRSSERRLESIHWVCSSKDVYNHPGKVLRGKGLPRGTNIYSFIGREMSTEESAERQEN